MGIKAAPHAVFGPCLVMKLRSRFCADLGEPEDSKARGEVSEPRLSPAASFRRHDWEKLCNSILSSNSSSKSVTSFSGFLSPAANSLRSRQLKVSPTVLHSASHFHVNKIFPEIFDPSKWHGKTPKQLLTEWLAQMPVASRMTVKYRTLPLPPGAHKQMHRVACDLNDSNESLVDSFECLIAFPTKSDAEQNAALLAIRDMHEITRALLSNPTDDRPAEPSPADGSGVQQDWRTALCTAALTARVGQCFSDQNRTVDLFGDKSCICVWIQRGECVHEFPEVLARVSDLKGLFRPASDVHNEMEDAKAWAIEWQADPSGEIVRVLSNLVPPVMPTEHVALPSSLHILASVMVPGDIVAVRADARLGWGLGGLVPLIPPRSPIDGIVTRWQSIDLPKRDLSKAAIEHAFARWATSSTDDASTAAAILNSRAVSMKELADKCCANGTLPMTRDSDYSTHSSLVRWNLAQNLYQLSQILRNAAASMQKTYDLADAVVPLRLNRALCGIALARLSEGSALAMSRARRAVVQSNHVLGTLKSLEESKFCNEQYLLWLVRANLRYAEAAMLCIDGDDSWSQSRSHLSAAQALLTKSTPYHMNEGYRKAQITLNHLSKELDSRINVDSKLASQIWKRAFSSSQH